MALSAPPVAPPLPMSIKYLSGIQNKIFKGLSDDFRESKLHEAVSPFQSWKSVVFVALLLCFSMRAYSFSKKIIQEKFGILSRML